MPQRNAPSIKSIAAEAGGRAYASDLSNGMSGQDITEAEIRQQCRAAIEYNCKAFCSPTLS